MNVFVLNYLFARRRHYKYKELSRSPEVSVENFDLRKHPQFTFLIDRKIAAKHNIGGRINMNIVLDELVSILTEF